MLLYLVEGEKRAVASLYSDQPAVVPDFNAGETVPVAIARVSRIASPATSRFFDPLSLSGWTNVRAALGVGNKLPIAGTFTLTFGADTTAAIAYNATAGAIETALNLLASVIAAGGLDVDDIGTAGDGFFAVTFRSNGTRTEIASDSTNLAPLSVVDVGTLLDGTASIREVQTIEISQQPATFVDLTTASAGAGITVTTVQAGGGGLNAKYRVKLNPLPYDGQWTITVRGIESSVINFDTSEADLVSILENISIHSGSLVTGAKYKIVSFATSDDFSNLGATNATGNVFVASGTTPTNWTHGSVLSPVAAGNVTAKKETDGQYLITFQGDMANTALGTLTADASGLQVVQFLSSDLPLDVPGIELLLNGADSLPVTFAVRGTPPAGSSQILFEYDATLDGTIFTPASETPQPRDSYYNETVSDARFVKIADVLDYGAQVFTPEKYGAAGDGTTDDFTAVQAAITAAQAVGGKVVLSKTYAISDTPVVSGAISIEGTGVNALYGDRSVYGSDVMPTASPYLTGAVLLQTTAGKDGLKITAVGKSVNLRNFGIRFAESIKFVNTGYGILADPGAYAGQKNNGVEGGRWESVYVYGHDGNHYAFLMINQAYMTFVDLEGYGGGGALFSSGTPTGFYGNSTWINPYFCVLCAGNAHGYWLNNSVSGHGVIYTTMIRPQAFFFGMTDGQALAATGLSHIDSPSTSTTTQYQFKADADTQYLNVIGADMEQAGATGFGVSIPPLDAGSSWVGGFGSHPEAQGTSFGMIKSVNRSLYPTTDPLVDGQLWLDSGVLTVSSG